SAGVALFPEHKADLSTECSCPDDANPCKHIAAVYYLLGEQFDADPFLLFQLRGRAKDQVIAELRARRGSVRHADESQPATLAETAAPAEPQIGSEEQETQPMHEQGPQLDELIDHFWDGDPEVESMEFAIARPEVEAAPIKLLGQPAFWKG